MEIKTLIDAMRVGFANGDLYTNVPIGKTREEVDRGISKVLTDHKAYLAERPDELKAIRDLEQRATNSGQSHLIKWLLYLDNPERQRQLDEMIAQNPGVNITAGNKDLEGTPWQSQFMAADPYIFRTPGLAPINPADFPSLPGSTLPSLDRLHQPEGFTPNNPLSTYGLPGFPAPAPSLQALWQLPPSRATPEDPLVLRFDPATGAPLPFSVRSPILEPDPPSSAMPPAALYGAAGIAALALAFPELAPLWAGLGAAGLAGAAAAAPDFTANAGHGAGTSGGGVFSTGTTPYNAFAAASRAGGSYPLGSASGWPLTGGKSVERYQATPLSDRFDDRTETPVSTTPAQAPSAEEAPAAAAAAAVAPEHVRRLTRVNASNAGNVFASGTAPVPYLPPLNPDTTITETDRDHLYNIIGSQLATILEGDDSYYPDGIQKSFGSEPMISNVLSAP